MLMVFILTPTLSKANYSENFDSYSDGDLNTLNSGTGFTGAWGNFIGCNTNYDIQGGTTQGGSTKAVQIISSAGGDRNCGRGLTDITTSEILTSYFYAGQTNQLAKIRYDMTGGDEAISINIRQTGQIAVYNDTTLTNLQAYSSGQWYKIEVTPNFATEQFTIEIDDVSYGPYDFYLKGTYTYTKIDSILFQAKDTGTGTYYFDTLEPAAGGGGGTAADQTFLDVGSTSPTTTPEETGQIIAHGFLVFFFSFMITLYVLYDFI